MDCSARLLVPATGLLVYCILASGPRQCVTDGSDGCWAQPLA